MRLRLRQVRRERGRIVGVMHEEVGERAPEEGNGRDAVQQGRLMNLGLLPLSRTLLFFALSAASSMHISPQRYHAASATSLVVTVTA
jgi:hypothetical protein